MLAVDEACHVVHQQALGRVFSEGRPEQRTAKRDTCDEKQGAEERLGLSGGPDGREEGAAGRDRHEADGDADGHVGRNHDASAAGDGEEDLHEPAADAVGVEERRERHS